MVIQTTDAHPIQGHRPVRYPLGTVKASMSAHRGLW